MGRLRKRLIRFAQQTLFQEFRRNGPGRTCGASGAGTKHWSSSACSLQLSFFCNKTIRLLLCSKRIITKQIIRQNTNCDLKKKKKKKKLPPKKKKKKKKKS